MQCSMVYIAFHKKDSFWKGESKALFVGKCYNHLTTLLGEVGSTGVEVWATDRTSRDNVLFYSGHGNSKGTPIKMTDANVFVQFLVDKRIAVDRIVMLSCHGYCWLCRHYRAFVRLLSAAHPALLLEGSREALRMINIRPIVCNGRNDTCIHFEGIRLTRYDPSSVAATAAQNLEVEGRVKSNYVERVLAEADGQNPVAVMACKDDFDRVRDRIF